MRLHDGVPCFLGECVTAAEVESNCQRLLLLLTHHVFLSRRAVLVRAQANEALLVQHHPQRAHRGHQDVHPQVELEAVDQERVGHVPLSHRGPL